MWICCCAESTSDGSDFQWSKDFVFQQCSKMQSVVACSECLYVTAHVLCSSIKAKIARFKLPIKYNGC